MTRKNRGAINKWVEVILVWVGAMGVGNVSPPTETESHKAKNPYPTIEKPFVYLPRVGAK